MERSIKAAVIKALIEKINIAILEKEKTILAQKEMIEEAPGAMQSRYDTRKVEGQYMLGAMEKGLKSMAAARDRLMKIDIDKPNNDLVEDEKLVKIRDTNMQQDLYFFILKEENVGGLTVECESLTVRLVSLGAPIIKSIYGKKKTMDKIKTGIPKIPVIQIIDIC